MKRLRKPSSLAAPGLGGKRIGPRAAFTFVEPVAEPVEDAALFAGGDQADGAALHRGAVVDVVFKNEDLRQEEERTECKCLLRQTGSGLAYVLALPSLPSPLRSRGALGDKR